LGLLTIFLFLVEFDLLLYLSGLVIPLFKYLVGFAVCTLNMCRETLIAIIAFSPANEIING
jgi:hypothetical protein